MRHGEDDSGEDDRLSMAATSSEWLVMECAVWKKKSEWGDVLSLMCAE